MAIERRKNGTVLPGSVTNPEGRNQFTYRREAEANFDRLLRKLIDNGQRTVSEVIIEKVLASAMESQPWAVDMVMKRILPPVERHEHSVDDTSEVSALLARLAGFAAARRTNGHYIEADTTGTPSTDEPGV